MEESGVVYCWMYHIANYFSLSVYADALDSHAWPGADLGLSAIGLVQMGIGGPAF